MQCQADIQELAKAKLTEADCLFANALFDGAYYLAGYSVELLLKAQVCKTLRIDDFFAFNKPKKEIYKPYKVHNYEQLLLLSGIYPEFESAQKDATFKAHWSVVSKWSEEVRYSLGMTSKDAKDFLTSVKEIAKWIEKFL